LNSKQLIIFQECCWY